MLPYRGVFLMPRILSIPRAGAFLLSIAMIAMMPAAADKLGCEYKNIDIARYGEKPFQCCARIGTEARATVPGREIRAS